MLPRISLKDSGTTELDAAFLKGIDLTHLKMSPILEYSLAREAGKYHVLVKVLPFIRKGDASVQVVDHFEKVLIFHHALVHTFIKADEPV